MEPGPIDPSVLYGQEGHRSQVVWDHGTEYRLQTRNHKPFRENDPRVLQYLHTAGFYGLYQLGYIRMDRSLVTALVERWRPETHTFHLPPGECTITLQDVEVICGLPVDGKAIINDLVINEEGWREACVASLGVNPGPKVKGGMLNMTWFRSWMQANPLPDDADDEVVRQRARGVILLLLGGQYLSDKTGNRVKLRYLPFIADLEMCSEYSWGSAILAILYRELCYAAWGGNDIAGPLILLQIWAWIRFPFVRPTDIDRLAQQPQIANEELPGYPYGYRWSYAAKNWDPETVSHNLRHFRDQFDGMHERQIIWEPYTGVLDHLPDYCRDGSDIWCTKVVLICFEVVAFYNGDRVLRQFGIRQNIPVAAPRDDKLHDHTGQGNRGTRWATKHNNWVEQWDGRRGMIVGGVYHNGVMPLDQDYMPWYRRITRLHMLPVKGVPSRGFQPIASNVSLMTSRLLECHQEFTLTNNQRMVSRLEDCFAELQVRMPEPQNQPEPHQQHEDNSQWVDEMLYEGTPVNIEYELGIDSGYRRRSPPRSAYEYGTQSGEMWRSCVGGGFGYGHASSSHAGESSSHAGESQEEEHFEPQTQYQSTEVPRRFRRVSSVNRDVRARRA